MAKRDFWSWVDNFAGHRVYSGTPGSNVGHNWLIADTSSSGTPTYVPVDGSLNGAIAIDFDNTSEIQNVCLYHADELWIDIDEVREVIWRVKMNQAALDSTSQLAFGVTSDRNAAIDSIADAALFRVIGADDTTAVVVETDDGTTNNDDVATGQTLINVEKEFVISFAAGKSDVRFFINGQPVATGTTFDMSAYSGALQPFLQLQKTADTNTDGVTVSYVEVRGYRS